LIKTTKLQVEQSSVAFCFTSGSEAGSRQGMMFAASSFDGNVRSNSSVSRRSQGRSCSSYFPQIFPRSSWYSFPSYSNKWFTNV